ncbi:MAG: xanthine dehydrogenase family protein subunit M [Rhizobiaceae bacterium]|nr:xanthine dehydrogenase family protein subunit M [Rhizobiaceae bacterium]
MQYERPETLKDAVGLLSNSKGKAFVLAGGSDLLVRMRGEYIDPDVIVDIKNVKGLDQVAKTAKGFSIGAAVPCAELGENKALKKAWPGVVEAANLIGSKQIQGRCTISGNLCNASPAADSVPALVAAGAKAVIAGPGRKRRVAVEKIVTAPGKTCLEKGELIEAIELGKQAARSGDAYLRFIPRTEMDIAVASAGVNLTLDNKGVVKSARVALGAVAPTVVLVKDAARAIIGTKLEEEALDKMALACAKACNPIDDKRGTIEFREKVSGVLAQRAAKIAYARAGGK